MNQARTITANYQQTGAYTVTSIPQGLTVNMPAARDHFCKKKCPTNIASIPDE